MYAKIRGTGSQSEMTVMHLQQFRRLCMGVERDPVSNVKIAAYITAIS